MQVPILREGDHLIVPIQGALTDEDLTDLRDRLVWEVDRERTQGVIVDVSGVDVLDSFSARTLWELAQMSRLCGARVVLVGIRPEIAAAAVQFGLTLQGVETAADLDAGTFSVRAGEKSGARNPDHEEPSTRTRSSRR